ncbi:polysaccharide pyruvyl transferase CsaB [filamentous cyanobacterium CCP5]|nr:polysaccharide pyruvyl transferase CsaB [filamentous cyanobacterium CCP5]
MRAVLCGYYGMGNGGDEALLASLLQMLPSHITPIVLSGDPIATAQQYGVEAVPRKQAFAVVRSLQSAQAFIWGGGSLMQDSTSWQNPLYYGGLMGLAQALGLKTIAWAQGIGPLRRPLTRFVARRTLQGTAAISVRDSHSVELLANWQLPCWQAPDPVWALDSKPVPGLWELPAPRIAVAVRGHASFTPQRIDQFARAIAAFQTATGTCVLLVPFQPQADLAVAQTIQTYLKGPNQILIEADPRRLKGIFRGVEMTIAMRLHALIMSAAEGCRCFALSYDPKVTYLMADLDLPGWDLTSLPQAPAQPWPDSPEAMTRAWLDYFVNGDPPSPDQIRSRIDRALLHRELLREALGN